VLGSPNVKLARMTSQLMLKCPDESRPYVLQTDAGIGEVLSQIGDDNMEKPVAFYSHKLQPREMNYSSIKKRVSGYSNGSQTFCSISHWTCLRALSTHLVLLRMLRQKEGPFLRSKLLHVRSGGGWSSCRLLS